MLTFLWLLSKLQFPPLYSSNFKVYFCSRGASFSLFEIVAILVSDEQYAATATSAPMHVIRSLCVILQTCSVRLNFVGKTHAEHIALFIY